MKGSDELTWPAGQAPELAQRAPRPGGGRLWSGIRKLSLLLVLCGLVFSGGFALFANHVSRLAAPASQPPADAIIVLTGGQSRLDAGVSLLKSGKGERLLISGAHPAAGRDALRAATGADRKLFSCCVDIDHEALDTIGNAEESAKWVRDHDYASVILVTNNYHMPRSLLEMGRLIDKARVIPYPVVNSNLANGGWLTRPDALRVLFTEYTKYLAALARAVLPLRQTAEGYAVVEASAAGARSR